MRILQWLLALVFAIAAGLKLAVMVRGGGGGAAETMFGALPQVYQWALVIAELALALWLGTGWCPRGAAFSTIVLLSTFLSAVIVELGKTDPHRCGCMGSISLGPPRTTLWITLAVDGLLLGGALGVYFAVSLTKKRA